MVTTATSFLSLTQFQIGILSALLIAVGVIIVLRDLRRPRARPRAGAPTSLAAQASASSGDAQQGGDVVVIRRSSVSAASTSVDPATPATWVPAEARAGRSNLPATVPRGRGPHASARQMLPAPVEQPAAPSRPATDLVRHSPETDALREMLQAIAEETEPRSAEIQRSPGIEQTWMSLEPMIAEAVVELNLIIAPIGLRIEPPGERTWSFGNVGFGAHRRLTVRGESRAWLRIEATAAGLLLLKVRAHKDDHAAINTATEVHAGRADVSSIREALARCLKPVAAGAAWIAAKHAATPAVVPDGEWSDVASIASASLDLVTGAFSQAGAALVPLELPNIDRESTRWRWPLSVVVDGTVVAMMHVERAGPAMEVVVGMPRPELAHLARRMRVEVAGLTAHALAETMASAAWPAIAEARERMRSGRPAA